MKRRIMGKASFCELQDSTGRIQLYVTRDDIAPGEDKELYNTVFKKLLDIGDFIGIKGYVFRTKMGEVSIHVQELKLLSKSLRPLPVVKVKDGVTYDAFGDPEQRYRMRYVDLVVNPQVKEVFIKRSKTFKAMREFLDARGYLEVETPILQSIPGGAAARPFVTHHNALDIPLYLRIANELYLKRLIVGGFNGVYEFSKNFRNEGMDRTHNPEFTAMEVYVPYTDYNWMMEMTEQMLEYIAIQVNGTTKTKVGDREIDFKAPYPRVTMRDAILKYTGFDIKGKSEEELREACKAQGLSLIHISRKQGIEVIDATCPVVLTLQKRIRTKYLEGLEEGQQIVIFGKRGHAEVNGLVGQTDGTAIVVQSVEEARELIDPSRAVALFSQTTMDQNQFEALHTALREWVHEGVKVEWYDTICRQVSNRVPEITQFAKEKDWVYFIAGAHSSNGKVLYQTALRANLNTHFITSPDEITTPLPSWVHTVGICGATSTPRWQMEAVKQKIEEQASTSQPHDK